MAKLEELFLKHCHRDHEGFDVGMENETSKAFYAGAHTAILNISEPKSAEIVEFISAPDGTPDNNLTCAYFHGLESVPVLMHKVNKFDDSIKLKLFDSWKKEAEKGTAA